MESTLKEIIYFSIGALLLLIIYLAFTLTSAIGEMGVETNYVCPLNVKSAIYKMGPGYDYKMIGERLYVNRGDGKWLRLHYKGGPK
jgi:hypothetical protein